MGKAAGIDRQAAMPLDHLRRFVRAMRPVTRDGGKHTELARSRSSIIDVEKLGNRVRIGMYFSELSGFHGGNGLQVFAREHPFAAIRPVPTRERTAVAGQEKAPIFRLKQRCTFEPEIIVTYQATETADLDRVLGAVPQAVDDF